MISFCDRIELGWLGVWFCNMAADELLFFVLLAKISEN